MPTLRRVRDRFGAPTFAGLGSAAMLAEHDVGGGVDLDWWQSVKVRQGSDVTVTLYPFTGSEAAMAHGALLSAPDTIRRGIGRWSASAVATNARPS